MTNRIYLAIKWRLKLFIKKIFEGKKYEKSCNICSNNIFIKGPNNRLSLTEKYPLCANCFSLERHRGLKVFWERFDKDFLRGLNVLQFSDDPGIDETWFKTYLVNSFGAENSLDIQKIDKPSESYDIVLCNQVIEHVPDDRSSIKELMRVTKKNGFVQLGVPYPMEIEKTIDWGYPNKSDHGHYRNYGRDICFLLDELIGKNKWLEITITDPVTNALDYIYILCHNIEVMAEYKKIISPKI